MKRALQWISRELKDIENNPDASFNVVPLADDMFHWKATIMGPPDSPYAGGAFDVTIHFPPVYPLKPPRVAFRTKVFHPKVGSNGNIGLDVSKDKWSPSYNIFTILLSIYYLLSDPIPDDALVPAIDDMYKADRHRYDTTARSWTEKHAMA